MTGSVDILLVEDNPNDVELTLHAFEKHTFVNCIHVVRDGEEALEFIFRTGAYAQRPIENSPSPDISLKKKRNPH